MCCTESPQKPMSSNWRYRTVWMVNERSRWTWHNVSHMTAAQRWRSSRGAGPFTRYSAVVEPWRGKKNAPIYHPELSCAFVSVCAFPCTCGSALCTQCGVWRRDAAQGSRRGWNSPRWELILRTVNLLVLDVFLLPFLIISTSREGTKYKII